MVEQRPFKALAAGSSPAQPSFLWLGLMSCAALLDGTTSDRLGDLERRLAEHQRGGNHTTHRFGNDLELIAFARVNSIAEARILEIQLKRKKNPRIAIAALTSLSQK
jgi:predicted GIY-YIG superfamily endonuclease